MSETLVIAVRHGKAAREPAGDPPLAEEGRDAIVAMAQRLAGSGVQAHLILTSPLARAQETAALLAQTLGGEVVVEAGLGSLFDGQAILAAIQPGQVNILVGHEPNLPLLVNELVGEEALAEGMSKASAAVVVFGPDLAWGKGRLRSYLTPDS